MKSKLRIKVALFLLLCVCLNIFMFNTSVSAISGDATVEFIKVGRGNATLIKSTSGSTTIYGLVDAGTSSQYTSYVKPYLTNELGSKKLTFIAVTHGDSDHAGGIVGAINDFANASTKVFLKDVATNNANDSKEKSVYSTNLAIKNAAKAKWASIVKIRPYENFTSTVSTVTNIRNLSLNKFKAKYEIFSRNANGNYVSNGIKYDTYTFGRYTMTWYNGNNWNSQPVVGSSWDENANATPIKLRCSTSTGKIYSTYLGSDLGENSSNGYSYEIADKVAQAVGKISIYQVAHHGFYYSIKPNTTMATLSPKYAIVTNSYNNVANTYYENYGVTYPGTSTDLARATSTIKEVIKSPDLIRIYFTNGKGNSPDHRILDALKANNYALLNWTGTTIKSGSVKIAFTGNSLSIVQE